MRRAPGIRLLVLLLSLPPAGSVIIVLSVPPLSEVVPAQAQEALRPIADVLFGLAARLPRDSLAGRLFHGSFAPLPEIFGGGALAAHALLLALPWVALAAGVAAWGRRAERKMISP